MMNFAEVKLSSLCKPDAIGIYGIPASAEDYSEDKVRYLRITDISDDGFLLNDDKKSVSDDNIEKYILHENDLVIARTGNSTGRAYLYNHEDGELAYAGFLIKFGLDTGKVNPMYLRYYTICDIYKNWVRNTSLGSTRGNMNAQTMADCMIRLPERKQQDFLVKVLSSIDRKISLNRRINSTLEAMTKQLYDYWFVQFDFPNEEGKPYKSSGGKMVWNEKLKREIPEGWEVKNINEVANNSCSTITPISGIVYRHYSIPAFDKNNLYDEEDGEYIQSNKYELTDNHIIVSKLNPWINRVIEVCNEKNAICSTEYVPITPEDKRYNSYLKFVVKTDEFISYCVNGSTGTSHSHRRCRPEFIMNYKIPWKEDVVIRFNDIVYKMLKKERINFSETRHLTSLRDFLLPLLMNGQVTINDK